MVLKGSLSVTELLKTYSEITSAQKQTLYSYETVLDEDFFSKEASIMAYIITLLLLTFQIFCEFNKQELMYMADNVHNYIVVCVYVKKITNIGNFVTTMWITFDLTLKNGQRFSMYKKEVIPYSGDSMKRLDVSQQSTVSWHLKHKVH